MQHCDCSVHRGGLKFHAQIHLLSLKVAHMHINENNHTDYSKCVFVLQGNPQGILKHAVGCKFHTYKFLTMLKRLKLVLF